MTIQVEHIILILFSKGMEDGMEDAEIKDEGLSAIIKAHNMAIRSLKAWDEIVEELADMEKEFETRHDCPRADTLKFAISIINKHLKGVTA